MAKAERCRADGCTHNAKRSGYCWGHLKRRQRCEAVELSQRAAAPLREYGEPTWVTLTKWAMRYADAASDGDFEVARDMLRKAAKRYAVSLQAR